MNIETILSRPSVRGLEFRLGLEAFAHKVGSALQLHRVRVLWRHDVQTAGMNSYGELYLAGIPDEATVSRALVVKYAGYVVHELLHHKYTDFGDIHNSNNQYIRTLHNAVEDGWIENTAIASGLLGNVGPLLGELIDTMTRDALASVKDWNDSRQYPYILAVACRKHATIKVPCNPRLTAIFDEAAVRCEKATSTADTLKIAEWVYEQIKQESEKPQGKSKDKPKDAPPKDQNGPTSPDQGQGEGEGAGEGDKPSDAPSGPVQSPVDVEAVSVEPTLAAGGSMGNYSADATLQHEEYHLSGFAIPDLVNAPIPAKLRYEVKRLFDDSGLSDFTRNRKAGSVNVHALPTVATGNDRVFKRRLEVEGVDSAVVICLDVSGSMFDDERGKKALIGPAVQTCRAMLETLNAAGVKTAVICFGSYISVPKGFNKTARQACTQLGTVKSGGGTNDYAALRYAHQMLAQRHERRKITFVITDGRGHPDAVRQQVNSGKALGVTTIGIGIKADVVDIYGNAVTVQDIADLGNTSFKQIKLAA